MLSGVNHLFGSKVNRYLSIQVIYQYSEMLGDHFIWFYELSEEENLVNKNPIPICSDLKYRIDSISDHGLDVLDKCGQYLAIV